MSFQNVGTYNAGVFTPKAAGPAPVGGVPVMDADGIASGGAFLVSELEKRDPLIRKPLTSFTYPRDIVIQTGGGWVDYVSAMSVAYGITGGVGFLLAIVLFASVRERMEFSKWPKAFDGFPIALVAASLISLAFMGFSGLKVW